MELEWEFPAFQPLLCAPHGLLAKNRLSPNTQSIRQYWHIYLSCRAPPKTRFGIVSSRFTHWALWASAHGPPQRDKKTTKVCAIFFRVIYTGGLGEPITAA